MPEPIVSLNEESLKADLRELVRRTVEEMLNGLLDEEADDLVGAERYERTAGAPPRFWCTFRQPHLPAIWCGYLSRLQRSTSASLKTQASSHLPQRTHLAASTTG